MNQQEQLRAQERAEWNARQAEGMRNWLAEVDRPRFLDAGLHRRSWLATLWAWLMGDT